MSREAGRSFPLTGYRAGVDLIAFVVNFKPTGSIAAWVGQHTLERETEKIIAQFHLTMDVADADELELLWSSIVTGTDTFLRVQPSNCR